MQMTFTPTLCDGVAFEGTITLKAPSFDERLEMFEDVSIDGEIDLKKNSIKIMRGVAKKSHLFVTGVAIKRLSDGYAFSKWDEIYHDSDMTPLIMEVCGKILGKFQAGPVAQS